MSGVLINQDKPIRILHQHVKFVQDADDLKLLITLGRNLCTARDFVRSLSVFALRDDNWQFAMRDLR